MRHLVALLWLVAVPMMLVAQDRLRIVSPEVRKDRSVVFRLWAPRRHGASLAPSSGSRGRRLRERRPVT
jgi:hypothetical protein